MPPDTDPKIKALTESTERRISDLYRQNKEDFAELRKRNREDFDEIKNIVKPLAIDVANARLELASIKTELPHLARRTDLIERVEEIKDYCISEFKANMRDHESRKHKSLPPRHPDGRLNGKVIGALVAAIVALAGVVAAVAAIIK